MRQEPAETSCSLSAVVLKLLAVLEEENASLRNYQFVSHGAYTDRKNQSLRELMAVQRQEGLQPLTGRLRNILERLSAELKENARLLKLHIAAVGDISDIIVGNLRDAESDGTYSRSRSFGGRG